MWKSFLFALIFHEPFIYKHAESKTMTNGKLISECKTGSAHHLTIYILDSACTQGPATSGIIFEILEFCVLYCMELDSDYVERHSLSPSVDTLE